MTKAELLKSKVFKSAPDNAVMAYEDMMGNFYLLGEPTKCFKSVVRFTSGVGTTKGVLLKSTAFKMARLDAEIEVELSDSVRAVLFERVRNENEYLMIKEKF